MLKNTSKTSTESALTKEMIKDATTFRAQFEALLAQLSAHNSDEANNLMAQALAAADAMNSSLMAHKEVAVSQLFSTHAIN